MAKKGFTFIELLVVIGILALLAALLFPTFARTRENARSTACLSNMRQIGAAFAAYTQDHDDTYPMNRFADRAHPRAACDADPPISMDGARVNWKRALLPYLTDKRLYLCPSNHYAWEKIWSPTRGDESNQAWSREEDQLPISYGYNGDFFHENAVCKRGEEWPRARRRNEIRDEAHLLLLIESRLAMPDLGTWTLDWKIPNDPAQKVLNTHNGMGNWLFTDGHSARKTLDATCKEKAWFNDDIDRANGDCSSTHPL